MSEKKIIPVFFATDDGYVKFLHVAIHSLKVNASKDYKYHVHVLTQGLTKSNEDSFKTFEDDDFKVFVEDLIRYMRQIRVQADNRRVLKFIYSFL